MTRVLAGADQEKLKVCTRRALEALAAIKKAISAFRELPEPQGSREKEMHQSIAHLLKQAHCETVGVLFATSLVDDSTAPQFPRTH
jgi:hypothetical protein